MLPIFCPLPSATCMCKRMRAYVRIYVCVIIFGSDCDSEVIWVMLEMPTLPSSHMHTHAHAHAHAHATVSTLSLTLMQRSQENVGNGAMGWLRSIGSIKL